MRNQWSDLMRTTPDLEELLHSLEEANARDFLPALIGVTQRDLLAMAIYAVGIMPLIWRLQVDCDEQHQIWFADDASATGSLNSL